ncbi:PREDICTED: uncharacterized protein LOC109333923 [Lupinus angustifolius]|uniref:uncharacterized protein LOC109333923 n=1 Tax=Lupinus angustifolius TaxID=3871 RepID=UPI00092E8E1C|nr:PREDICTED: uncharacterized protein LOC109333923 [Lupinus angustifolius]
MGPEAFMLLCHKLRGTGQNWKNFALSFYFHRSGETVSRHFHNVLRAIISLEDEFLVQFDGDDYVGAIDGTHFRVKVPRAEQPRFRGRKEFSTQNVLAACNFDMKFTYVLAGWEDTSSDSRILKDVLTREDPLILPEEKYYIGDAGFMLKLGILTPNRGVRYHLKEYSRRGPQNPRELFNHLHASLRNVIERSFGVLKERFPIISSGTEPHYSFDVMTNIVLACYILHNFLMWIDADDELIAKVDRELLEQEVDNSQIQQRDDDYRQGAILRDNVSMEMRNAY